MAEKLQSLQTHWVFKPNGQVLGEIAEFARDPASTHARSELVICIDRSDTVGRICGAYFCDLVIERHGAEAVILLLLSFLVAI